METSTLERIGLTKNESIVYLTLLKLGTSKSGEILKASNLNSGKIYEIFSSLKQKGLISESVINKVKHFTAAPPSQISRYLRKKKKELQEEESLLEKEIPELEKIRNIATKESYALTYTGYKGLKIAADEALDSMKKGEEILAMGVTEKKDKKYNELWKKFSLKRIQRKIMAKHIFSERSQYLKDFKKMQYTQTKILDNLTPVAIDIFGSGSVLILNYEKESWILIKDKEIVTSFTTFFKQLWKISKS